MATHLHEERLDTVVQTLLDSGAETVLDLGCGPGELLLLLAQQAQFRRIVGIDTSGEALQEARRQLLQSRHEPDGTRLTLYHASFTEFVDELSGFDAVALVETIEHVAPGRLSLVERAVFGGYRPQTALITTPNREYNVIHGMREGQMRHPDHFFEWDRIKFRRWSDGIALRNGYEVTFADIGEVDQTFGGSSQMAVFTRR